MKHFFRTAPLFVFLLIFSCNEDLESQPEQKPVAFERVRNLVWARGDVGNLAVFHDQLYYSNNSNPGYFTRDGEHRQFGARKYNMEMGQALSEDFTIAVDHELRSFTFIPTTNYASNYSNPLRVEHIEGVPDPAIINSGWFMSPNFGINGNHFIASFKSFTTGGKAMIMELDIRSSFTKFLVPIQLGKPVIRQIEIDAKIDGFGIYNLISVFPFREGWVASAEIAGYQNSFFITKDGNATRFPDESSNERFVMLSFHETAQGELYVSTEQGIYFSATGNLEDLTHIASANAATVRLRFIDDRMLMFYGTDQVYEVINYEDPETIELRELENLGLEGLLVRDIIEFNGKVWVATNAGLFTKPYDDFWKEKPQPQEEMQTQVLDFNN